jgi:hypothetical protein
VTCHINLILDRDRTESLALLTGEVRLSCQTTGVCAVNLDMSGTPATPLIYTIDG